MFLILMLALSCVLLLITSINIIINVRLGFQESISFRDISTIGVFIMNVITFLILFNDYRKKNKL